MTHLRAGWREPHASAAEGREPLNQHHFKSQPKLCDGAVPIENVLGGEILGQHMGQPDGKGKRCSTEQL